VRNVTVFAALLIVVCMLAGLNGCVLTRMNVIGSGILETREMEFSGFTELRVGSAFEVEVVRSDVHSVSITVDNNLFEHLSVKKSGRTLFVGLKAGNYTQTTQRATISMPDLEYLALSGASRGTISGFSSSRSLKLALSGASWLHTADMQAGNTTFELSGASDLSGGIRMGDARINLSGASSIQLEGSAGDVIIQASGASGATVADLPCENVKVSLTGASNATVNAGGTLDASLSGASRLEYLGTPALGSLSVSGGSTMFRK